MRHCRYHLSPPLNDKILSFSSNENTTEREGEGVRRGDFQAAEKLFIEAITYDQDLFTAKNNLVLARAAQRKYQLPVIRMTQVEKAELTHTMAISAIKQGDIEIGRGLLEDAIETHPQHFDAAVRTLAALNKNRI